MYFRAYLFGQLLKGTSALRLSEIGVHLLELRNGERNDHFPDLCLMILDSLLVLELMLQSHFDR